MSPRSLEQCLIESDPARLEAIARLWGLERLPGRHREAAAILRERMLAPGKLEQTWSALSSSERAALSTLQTAESGMPWLTFTRRWGQVRAMGPGRIARERPWETPVSPTEGLWYRGLVFRAFVEGPTGLYEVAFIPDELRTRLPAPPSLPSLRLTPTAAPPAVIPADDCLLDDGCTFLAYLQNHRVRLRPGRKWPSKDKTRLTRRLRVRHPDRLALLHHLAQRLGWLRTDRAGCLRPNPGPVTVWFQASTGEQRATLARAWRDDPTWNDLWHVPTLRPDDTGSWCNDPLLARQSILRYLSACQPGEWYSLALFVAAVKKTDPDFQRPDGDYSTWYIRDTATGAYLRGFESWDVVEGALIRYVITGPLAWLGLVDLGAGKKPGFSQKPGFWDAFTFRLSPAGAAFLGLAEPEQETEQEPEPLVVRPDLTILVPAARRYERFQLSRVADWAHTGAPYIYRLTPASLERARRQRITPDKVSAFFKRVTNGNVPRTLETILSRWASHGPQVQLEQGVLLRVRDEGLMQEIASAPATRRFIREVIGPTAALVAPADWPRLVRALVQRGLLPDLVGLEEGTLPAAPEVLSTTEDTR